MDLPQDNKTYTQQTPSTRTSCQIGRKWSIGSAIQVDNFKAQETKMQQVQTRGSKRYFSLVLGPLNQ